MPFDDMSLGSAWIDPGCEPLDVADLYMEKPENSITLLKNLDKSEKRNVVKVRKNPAQPQKYNAVDASQRLQGFQQYAKERDQQRAMAVADAITTRLKR